MACERPISSVRRSSFLMSRSSSQPPPGFQPVSSRTHHAVHARKRDASQDEGSYRGGKVHPAGKTARCDNAAVAQGGAYIRQGMAAHHVDCAGPAFLGQRLARGRELRALQDLCCAQLPQKFRFGRPAGHGGHPKLKLREHGHRNASHAARRARHQHVPAAGGDAMPLQSHHAQHGRIAGGADGHRLARVNALGSGISHSPLTRANLRRARPNGFHRLPSRSREPCRRSCRTSCWNSRRVPAKSIPGTIGN